MVNYHSTLVTTLQNILPTYYEMTLTKDCSVPCISYMESNNHVNASGETIEYSNITYIIKVWAESIAEIQQYTAQIDDALRQLGWRRKGSTEIYDNNSAMIQKVMTYEALFYEDFEYTPETLHKFVGTCTGDGITQAFTLSHNLHTVDTIVQVYDSESGNIVFVDIERTIDTINVIFSVPPAIDEDFIVVILS